MVADTCCDLRESLLARSVHHLVTRARELEALGVGLVITDQSIDTTTPTGRLLFTVLAAIAEFERELIRERVVAGVQRAKAKGKRLGRPPGARRQVQVERSRSSSRVACQRGRSLVSSVSAGPPWRGRWRLPDVARNPTFR